MITHDLSRFQNSLFACHSCPTIAFATNATTPTSSTTTDVLCMRLLVKPRVVPCYGKVHNFRGNATLGGAVGSVKLSCTRKAQGAKLLVAFVTVQAGSSACARINVKKSRNDIILYPVGQRECTSTVVKETMDFPFRFSIGKSSKQTHHTRRRWAEDLPLPAYSCCCSHHAHVLLGYSMRKRHLLRLNLMPPSCVSVPVPFIPSCSFAIQEREVT